MILNSKTMPLVTLAAGLCGFASYLLLIRVDEALATPQLLLWIALVLISTSLVFLRNVTSKKMFLLALLATSALFAFWFWLRFGNSMLFPDLYSEIAAAQNVKEFGWTTALISNNRFGDAISITVLPTVISSLIGIQVLDVFLFIFPVVLSITPILLFLVFNETFGFEIASLSGIIYLFDYVALTLNPFLIRDSFGKFFFLLALICLVKIVKSRSRKYFLPFILFAFATITSSHTPAYFLLGFVLCVVIVQYASTFISRIKIVRHRIERNQMFSPLLMSCIFVLILAWLSFVGYFVLKEAIQQTLLKTLQEMAFAQTHPFSHFAFSFPRGNFVSNMVTTLYRGSIVVGFFCALYMTSVNIKKYWAFCFTVFGGVLLVFVLIVSFLPGLGVDIFAPDRPYSYGLLFFSAFISWTLLSLVQIVERIRKKKTNKYFTKLFFSIVIGIFLLNSFYVMPQLYYRSSSSVSTEERIIVPLFGENELSIQQWKEEYVQFQATLVTDDLLSHVSILLANDIQWKNQTNYPINMLKLLFNNSLSKSSPFNGTCLFLITPYMYNQGYFVYSFYYSREFVLPTNATLADSFPTYAVVEIDKNTVNNILSKTDIIYSNGNYSLFLQP
jgi:uncharacterized membrane protein